MKVRGRKRWWVLALGCAGLFQAWHGVRDASRVRVVVYNESRRGWDDATLSGAGRSEALGVMAEEDSRYAWFAPEERTGVVVLNWSVDGEAREEGWTVERGERLVVRVREEGPAMVSRERSWGRAAWQWALGE